MDSKDKLSLTTRSLHWLIAICFIALIAVGIYMVTTETYSLYSMHKSMGVILLVIILLRVGWRIKQGWPAPVGQYQKTEQFMAKATHWVLLLGTIVMPIAGMLYSGMSGHGFGVFGWTIVKAKFDPLNPDKVIPYSELLSAIGEQTHEIIGYMLVVTIVLHIAGACKHHFRDKDRTLLRMLGK